MLNFETDTERVTAEITSNDVLRIAREVGMPVSAREAESFLRDGARAHRMWKQMMEAGRQYMPKPWKPSAATCGGATCPSRAIVPRSTTHDNPMVVAQCCWCGAHFHRGAGVDGKARPPINRCPPGVSRTSTAVASCLPARQSLPLPPSLIESSTYDIPSSGDHDKKRVKSKILMRNDLAVCEYN